MPLSTRLTERFGLVHPIVLAPMAVAAGGRLAAAVSDAGGLGLVGGGYGDKDWIDTQLDIADSSSVGVGFITWAVARSPGLLERVLGRRPRAILLSFGDPRDLAPLVKDAGVPLLCQVQSREDAELAIAAGADVIVAQGSEAGGHGDTRGTLTLVPEIADLLAGSSPETLLCAAGGIADGRGLAAALVLGADGVLVGSRLWATAEANVSDSMHEAVLTSTGDGTIRTAAADIVRKLDWPERFTARVLRNRFTDTWHGREVELRGADPQVQREWLEGWADGDPERSNVFTGEGIGLIHSIEPAASVLDQMSTLATALLRLG
jgi:nitronate monooxygenase